MKHLRTFAFVALILLTLYNTYRVVAMDAWLSAEVATRRDEASRLIPLNRADALAYFLSRDIAAEHAKEPK